MESWVASTASRWAWISASLLALSAALSPAGCSRGEDEAALPFYSTPDFTAEWIEPGSPEESAIHHIAPFSFTDQDGEQVARESLRGKVYVANFFFSSCPTVCPKMTRTFKRIQDAFAGEAGVALVSHTVDPETDTPEHLAEFARENGVRSGQWHLVTGEQAAIYTLARTSYFAEKRIGYNKKTDEFLHTENMILVDRQGRIRGVYNATLPAEATRVVEDIKLLLAER